VSFFWAKIAELQKETLNFSMFVICLSSWKNLNPTGQIFAKFYIWGEEKNQGWLELVKNSRHCA
jgi:hypothetical protein